MAEFTSSQAEDNFQARGLYEMYYSAALAGLSKNSVYNSQIGGAYGIRRADSLATATQAYNDAAVTMEMRSLPMSQNIQPYQMLPATVSAGTALLYKVQANIFLPDGSLANLEYVNVPSDSALSKEDILKLAAVPTDWAEESELTIEPLEVTEAYVNSKPR